MRLSFKKTLEKILSLLGILKKNYIVKNIDITGTTNPNGILVLSTTQGWDNSKMFMLSAITYIQDSIVVLGFATNAGQWVKVMNYQFTPYANTSVSLRIYYVDIRGTQE